MSVLHAEELSCWGRGVQKSETTKPRGARGQAKAESEVDRGAERPEV